MLLERGMRRAHGPWARIKASSFTSAKANQGSGNLSFPLKAVKHHHTLQVLGQLENLALVTCTMVSQQVNSLAKAALAKCITEIRYWATTERLTTPEAAGIFLRLHMDAFLSAWEIAAFHKVSGSASRSSWALCRWIVT